MKTFILQRSVGAAIHGLSRPSAFAPVADALAGFATVSAIAVGLLVWAWWRRSVPTAAAACAVTLLAGLWWQPWQGLSAASEFPGGSDWAFLWEVVTAGWALVLLGGVGCLVALIQWRRL